ncbi:Uncharacterised protein, partial [Mycoplasmopsis edwardii]
MALINENNVPSQINFLKSDANEKRSFNVFQVDTFSLCSITSFLTDLIDFYIHLHIMDMKLLILHVYHLQW